MEELRETISKTHLMPEHILCEFISHWEVIKHQKNSIISEPGKIDRYLYFTSSGVQKAYFFDNGKEKVISFTHAYSFTCAPESFLTQNPSRYYFQCITDSEFFRISYRDFNKLINKYPDLQIFLNKSLMNLVNGLTDRFIKQSTYSIDMRFKDFMLKRGHLINEIPQKDIANFLNMNSTNFSKLINKIKV